MKKLVLILATLGLFFSCNPENNPNNSDDAAKGLSAIDLGLSVKWGSCNLGASKPEEFGNYYAWGETEPKDNYSRETYKFIETDPTGKIYYTKYCSQDRLTELKAEDDAATIALGGKWRMPTGDELKELVDKCTWTLTTQNGVTGYLVTGPSGNSIFLPGAGERSYTDLHYQGEPSYWSSSVYNKGPDVWCIGINDYKIWFHGTLRWYGYTIRPVTD